MQKKYKLALHIFRRDLRLDDNSALISATQSAEQVVACFIFDDRQLGDNPYKSQRAIQFMLESLHSLDDELKKRDGKLYYFYGRAEDVIAELLKTHCVEAVFINRDYTPFSRKRDAAIAAACKQNSIDFHVYADALLHEPEQVLKQNNQPYTVYTPFMRQARTIEVAAAHTLKKIIGFYNKPINGAIPHIPPALDVAKQSQSFTQGGSKQAKLLLANLGNLLNYKETRDYPAQNGTTGLSAHNKFGTVSIRELYWQVVKKLGPQHTLINELYWRDFFTHIGFHFPKVFEQAFHDKYVHIPWQNREDYFNAWTVGMTGFPIVDAGMRELNNTGYMHNRVRMIVASFLCKDLHIDWRWGEKYFAQKLIDYDPAVNNGNWQWAASTGCDAQPYFRIFNPWLQQAKFDADCLYIKKWVPELAKLPTESIQHWYEQENRVKVDYPQPIVNHRIQAEDAKKLYQSRSG